MKKNKTARIVAFIGALGASAALIGAAATTTGAYFTDSKSGQPRRQLRQGRAEPRRQLRRELQRPASG